MQYLKKAKAKLSEKVEEVSNALQTAGLPQDAALAAYMTKVEKLTEMVLTMKKNNSQYASAVTAMSGSALAVANQLGQFYKQSESRKKMVASFSETNFRIDALAVDVFKEQFGWDVLKSFEDWEQDMKKILGEVRRLEQAQHQKQALEEKVQAQKAAKERRAMAGKDLNEREQQTYDDSLAKLAKYNRALKKLKGNLDKDVKKLVDGRFAKMDAIFVRLMECQLEFFKKAASLAESFRPSIENYRSRFPRESTNQDDESDDSGSEDETASPRSSSSPQKAHVSEPVPEPTMDILGGYAAPSVESSYSAPTPEVPASSNASNGGGILDLDLFAGGSTAAPAAAHLAAPAAASAGGDEFDFFGSPSVSPPAASPPSEPAGGFDPFDPFNQAPATQPVKQAFTQPAASASGLDAFGDMQGGWGGGISSSEPGDALAQYKAVENKKAVDAAAKDSARKGLESKLSAWEFKNGTRNNIRTLLATLHTVMWEGSKWKKCSLADLLDARKVRLKYRKSLLAVHPDKVRSEAPAEHKVIAQRCFEVLNESWQVFDAQNN